MSFWIACLSLFTFVVGNMMGQHGWHAFWASVLGEGDDSLIVYTGTVSPVAFVPDYEQWYAYGGNPLEHTYRQVPSNVLIPLPEYDSVSMRSDDSASLFYSVGYMGTYETGREGEGSHPAVDIRVPEGTPVVSIANGIVSEVTVDAGGFGQTIVIKHPNTPDPNDPNKTTTLYSSYAHLSAMYVSVGTIVQKGEQIGLSGSTGYASGPHLHFQIDRESAPWHPYWPFTADEAHNVGYSLADALNAGLNQGNGYTYTVNPMLYVQANYRPVTMIAQEASSANATEDKEEWSLLSAVERRRQERLKNTSVVVAFASSSSSSSRELTAGSASSVSSTMTVVQRGTTTVSQIQSRREERLRARLAQREHRSSLVAARAAAPSIVASTTTVASDVVEGPFNTSMNEAVASVEFTHDGEFTGRSWEKVRVTLLDSDGNLVSNPALPGDLYLRTAYGEAEFRPSVLSALDFTNGSAVIHVLPRGRRTVVIEAPQYQERSGPMRYVR